MSEQNTNKEITRYKWEYGNFLSMVEKKKITNAVLYAQMLNIDRRTLVHWMSQPELHEAMENALEELTEGMKTAGAKDWRMWRELLNMLGIKDVKEFDIKSDGEKLQPATIVDLGNLHADKSKAE